MENLLEALKRSCSNQCTRAPTGINETPLPYISDLRHANSAVLFAHEKQLKDLHQSLEDEKTLYRTTRRCQSRLISKTVTSQSLYIYMDKNLEMWILDAVNSGMLNLRFLFSLKKIHPLAFGVLDFSNSTYRAVWYLRFTRDKLGSCISMCSRKDKPQYCDTRISRHGKLLIAKDNCALPLCKKDVSVAYLDMILCNVNNTDDITPLSYIPREECDTVAYREFRKIASLLIITRLFWLLVPDKTIETYKFMREGCRLLYYFYDGFLKGHLLGNSMSHPHYFPIYKKTETDWIIEYKEHPVLEIYTAAKSLDDLWVYEQDIQWEKIKDIDEGGGGKRARLTEKDANESMCIWIVAYLYIWIDYNIKHMFTSTKHMDSDNKNEMLDTLIESLAYIMTMCNSRNTPTML